MSKCNHTANVSSLRVDECAECLRESAVRLHDPAPAFVELRQLKIVLDYLEALESVPLHKILWTREGVGVPVTQEEIDDWKFIGLNNRDFARVHLLGERFKL